MAITIIALFRYADIMLSAEKKVREAGVENVIVISPVPIPVPGITEENVNPLRYFPLLGGLAGALFGCSFALWASIAYPLPRGGRAIAAIPPLIIISFETLILFGVLATFAGFLIKSRLPALKERPCHIDTVIDRFGLVIKMEHGKRETVEKLLREEGAEEVVEETGDW